MSNWASKLQRKDSVKEGSKKDNGKASYAGNPSKATPPPPGSGSPPFEASETHKAGVSDEAAFNRADLAAFLAKSYAAAVEEAKKDKSGEKVRVYRSLESHSGWTKAVSSKKEDRHMNIVAEVSRQVAQSVGNGPRARK